jgi:4'-phosphopantetheinyl transferase
MSAEGELLCFSSPIRQIGHSTDVYWLEQTQGDVPAGTDWLGPMEAECLQSLHFAKRRNDWLLGRWTAKQALAESLGAPYDFAALARIEILAAESGAPEIFLSGQKIHTTISLSHRAGMAMCCVSFGGGRVGCDLETTETRSGAFIADYFTARERALIERTPEKDRSLLVALLWGAKESALKALQVGLRLDTNSLEVRTLVTAAEAKAEWPAVPRRITQSENGDVEPARWRPLEVIADFITKDRQLFRGWWREADGMVRSILCQAH